MRSQFIESLVELAFRDRSITFLTGDLGFNVVEPFQASHPDRFVNCGVAEQLMVSVAAGMALSGRKPFVYSIVNFATFRALEQIRNDVCFHGLPVCIVSVGAGKMYGSLGYSHHGLEDMAVMRAIPGLRIYSPADVHEVRASVVEIAQLGSPSYLRLGRAPSRPVHDVAPDTPLSAIELIPGKDVTLIATGPLVADALRAAEALQIDGISAQVIDVPLVAPLPVKDIVSMGLSDRIATIEEHSITGGLGSAVLEGLSEAGIFKKFLRIGYPPTTKGQSGSHGYLLSIAGLDAGGIANRIREFCHVD